MWSLYTLSSWLQRNDDHIPEQHGEIWRQFSLNAQQTQFYTTWRQSGSLGCVFLSLFLNRWVKLSNLTKALSKPEEVRLFPETVSHTVSHFVVITFWNEARHLLLKANKWRRRRREGDGSRAGSSPGCLKCIGTIGDFKLWQPNKCSHERIHLRV